MTNTDNQEPNWDKARIWISNDDGFTEITAESKADNTFIVPKPIETTFVKAMREAPIVYFDENSQIEG